MKKYLILVLVFVCSCSRTDSNVEMVMREFLFCINNNLNKEAYALFANDIKQTVNYNVFLETLKYNNVWGDSHATYKVFKHNDNKTYHLFSRKTVFGIYELVIKNSSNRLVYGKINIAYVEDQGYVVVYFELKPIDERIYKKSFEETEESGNLFSKDEISAANERFSKKYNK